MPDELTSEQRYQARQIFEGKAAGASPCMHCGGVHLRACPRVQEIGWHPDGSVIKAVYWPRGEWDDDNIIWPEQAYDDDGEEPA